MVGRSNCTNKTEFLNFSGMVWKIALPNKIKPFFFNKAIYKIKFIFCKIVFVKKKDIYIYLRILPI